MSYYYEDTGYAGYGSYEPEPDWDTFEQAEMEYADQGGYLQEEEYHNHHLAEPEYEGNDTYEHGTLEHDDDDVHVFAPPDHDAIKPHAPSNASYVPTYPSSVSTYPNTHLPAPTPIPRPRDIPDANQQGHVTASNHTQDARELVRAGYNVDDHACADYDTAEPTHALCYTQNPEPDSDTLLELRELEDMYAKWGHEPPTALFDEYCNTGSPTYAHTPVIPSPPPLPTPPVYTYLETLRRNYNNGIPSAIAFMQKLQDYTEECRFEQEEWKADEREVIRNNHNITYPKRDTQATPRSWSAEGCEYSTPDEIEQSRPLGPGLKRRRYRNFRTPRYRVTQPRPPLVPRPPPELDDNTTFDTPPPPTTRINKHHTNNHTPKPPRNINFDTTPYLTSQSRPPPWPNKNSNKNRNKYYYGTHTPAGTTTRRRPPPWPIIPTPTTIYSITNSRPPPWPNTCHCRHKQHSPVSSTPHARPPPWPILPRYIHSTSQNRRNAKRRVKAKSRIISDEVSI
jgi:hypothetical protein